MRIKTAVIITTYNRPDALVAALKGYEIQGDKDFDIIIADDGSTEETWRVIEQYQAKNSLNISHVWQEDRGFRAAAIRNKAIRATDADYIIFSDGDCIPLWDFVYHHKRFAEQRWFVSGNRILLNDRFTHRVLKARVPVHNWGRRKLIRAYFRGETNRWQPLVFIPFGRMLRRMTSRQWQGVMTCNLSAWREDLININGFDENYHGWGLEDSDLVIRLLRSGIRHKSARFAATVLHLWHPENDRSTFLENEKRLDALLRDTRWRANKGVFPSE